MLVPNTLSANFSKLLIPRLASMPPPIPPTIPPMGLDNGPTKGATGGIIALPALAPNKTPGVARAPSIAEEAKALKPVASVPGPILGLGYIPNAAPLLPSTVGVVDLLPPLSIASSKEKEVGLFKVGVDASSKENSAILYSVTNLEPSHLAKPLGVV